MMVHNVIPVLGSQKQWGFVCLFFWFFQTGVSLAGLELSEIWLLLPGALDPTLSTHWWKVRYSLSQVTSALISLRVNEDIDLESSTCQGPGA